MNHVNKFENPNFCFRKLINSKLLLAFPALTFGFSILFSKDPVLCRGLLKKQNAEIVIENWLHFEGSRYDILAFVVMPNHVHMLIKVYSGFKLTNIIQSWKSYTPKLIKPKGKFSVWFREYYDRYISDEDHLYRVIEYIGQNSVKAGLVKNSGVWPYFLVREL